MHLSRVLSRNWEQAALSYSWPPICMYACIPAPRPPLTPSGSLVSQGSQFRGPAGLWFSFSSPLAALTQDSSTLFVFTFSQLPYQPMENTLAKVTRLCSLPHSHFQVHEGHLDRTVPRTSQIPGGQEWTHHPPKSACLPVFPTSVRDATTHPGAQGRKPGRHPRLCRTSPILVSWLSLLSNSCHLSQSSLQQLGSPTWVHISLAWTMAIADLLVSLLLLWNSLQTVSRVTIDSGNLTMRSCSCFLFPHYSLLRDIEYSSLWLYSRTLLFIHYI